MKPLEDKHKAKGNGPCDNPECKARVTFLWDEDEVGPFARFKCPECGHDNFVRTSWNEWDGIELGKH